MNGFAFSTCRVSDMNQQHLQSLKEAINSGIKLIVTAPDHADSSAERAVGRVLSAVDKDKKSGVGIISKYGHIRGVRLKEYKEDQKAIKETDSVVEYSDDHYHCISALFMQDELSASLHRLAEESLECYLISDPHYYLLDAAKKGLSIDERLDEMYRRLEDAFVGLEKEVAKGRIGSYGVSSEGFALYHSDPGFLPYEDLLTLAQNAAQIAGNKKHNFTTVELPVNILEQEGLKCARWAKKNGLRVLACRPLNAISSGRSYRLADYEQGRDYYLYLNEILEAADIEELRPLYNLVEELDASKHKFGWIGDYDLFLFMQVLPHIKRIFENLEQSKSASMVEFIDLYLQEYRKMVLHECSRRTRAEFSGLFDECYSTMQECAFEFLMHQESIDYIVTGMRKPSYVHEILSLQK